MVKLQEAENQIITSYEVYARRPNDSDLLLAAIETHQALLGRAPHLLAADAAFYSAKNEVAAKAKGVKRVCIPNRSTKSLERKREQKKRSFRNGQKWRTGCEGRISVAKRRHGFGRCRYKRYVGMHRWVGFGVIADNLINIDRAIESRRLLKPPQHHQVCTPAGHPRQPLPCPAQWTTIPADNVDEDYLIVPRRWDISSILKFMLFIGPISSIFDYVTYFAMIYLFDAWNNATLFLPGGFVESL
jgi:hypothetical protein